MGYWLDGNLRGATWLLAPHLGNRSGRITECSNELDGGEIVIRLQNLRQLVARCIDYFWPGPWYPNVFWMLHSMWLSRCLYVAAKLGIADLLDESPKTCKELAQLTDCHEQSLHRVLRALASFRVFSEDQRGRFRITPRACQLLSDADDSMRYWAIKMGEEGWLATTAMLEAVQTGRSGFEIVHGKSSWDYYRDNPQASDNFIKAMDLFTQQQVAELAAVGEFGRFRKLVDVGGGRGALAIEILKRHPKIEATVFDSAETIPETRSLIASAGLQNRCKGVSGNFLEAVPVGADLYISKHSLRDWNDQSVVQILLSIREAIPVEGTLMVIDAVIQPANGTDRLVKLLDVELLIEEGGGMRTLDEFDALLAQANFKRTRVLRTTIRDATIIEAVPV